MLNPAAPPHPPSYAPERQSAALQRVEQRHQAGQVGAIYVKHYVIRLTGEGMGCRGMGMLRVYQKHLGHGGGCPRGLMLGPGAEGATWRPGKGVFRVKAGCPQKHLICPLPTRAVSIPFGVHNQQQGSSLGEGGRDLRCREGRTPRDPACSLLFIPRVEWCTRCADLTLLEYAHAHTQCDVVEMSSP